MSADRTERGSDSRHRRVGASTSVAFDEDDDPFRDGEPFDEDDDPSSNLPAVLVGLVGLFALCWFGFYYLQLTGARAESTKHREAKIVDHLREVGAAQERFADVDLNGNGVYDFATRLEDLIVVVPRSLSQAYFVETGTLGETGWYVVADPRQAGNRCFYLDHQGVVYVSPRPIEGPLDPLDLPPEVTPFAP